MSTVIYCTRRLTSTIIRPIKRSINVVVWINTLPLQMMAYASAKLRWSLAVETWDGREVIYLPNLGIRRRGFILKLRSWS